MKELTCKAFQKYAEKYFLDPTISSTSRKNRQTALWKFESYIVEEGIEVITTKTLLDFRGTLIGFKPNSIAQYMRRLNSFFNWLVSMKILKESPMSPNLLTNERYREKKAILRKEDIFRMVGARRPDGLCRKVWLRNKAMCFVAMSSGMRRGEMISMRPVDIDPENRSVTIPSGKGSKGRVVSITKLALDAIMEYQLYSRPEEATDTDPLFCRIVNGEVVAMAQSVMEYGIKKYVVDTTGREDITPHCLRHTFASILASNGVSILEIQSLLGHSSVMQTIRYVQQLGTTTEAVRHASDAIEGALSPANWLAKRGKEEGPTLLI